MSALNQKPSAIESFQDITNNLLDLAKIPAFLRVLLTTDGTVTKSLEAFFWEPLIVETISQNEIVLDEPAPYIERDTGDRVVARSVHLRGLQSNNIYVTANSLVCIDVLNPQFQEDLRMQRLGIGELLRECNLETYRQILEVGEDRRKDEVWRTYRIVTEHHPFIQITEHFPLSLY